MLVLWHCGIHYEYLSMQYIVYTLRLKFSFFIIISFKIKCLKTFDTLFICQVMFKFMFCDERVCVFLRPRVVTLRLKKSCKPSVQRSACITSSIFALFDLVKCHNKPE